jgi:hypothetical protein
MPSAPPATVKTNDDDDDDDYDGGDDGGGISTGDALDVESLAVSSLMEEVQSRHVYDAGGSGDCGPLTIRALLLYVGALPTNKKGEPISMKDVRRRVARRRKVAFEMGKQWNDKDIAAAAEVFNVRIAVLNLEAPLGHQLQVFHPRSASAHHVLFVLGGGPAEQHFRPLLPRDANPVEVSQRLNVRYVRPMCDLIFVEGMVGGVRGVKEFDTALHRACLDNARLYGINLSCLIAPLEGGQRRSLVRVLNFLLQNNPHVFTADIRSLVAPTNIVIGGEKPGKTSTVSSILGRPIGFTLDTLATRCPVVYMIFYDPSVKDGIVADVVDNVIGRFSCQDIDVSQVAGRVKAVMDAIVETGGNNAVTDVPLYVNLRSSNPKTVTTSVFDCPGITGGNAGKTFTERVLDVSRRIVQKSVIPEGSSSWAYVVQKVSSSSFLPSSISRLPFLTDITQYPNKDWRESEERLMDARDPVRGGQTCDMQAHCAGLHAHR